MRSAPDAGPDIVAACRGGDLGACRGLTRICQRDLLRAAYLLTGSAPAAEHLARETLLGYVRVAGDEEQPDPRQALLEDLVRRFLRAPRQPREEIPSSERYAVEGEAERLRAALDLLDPAARSALVLGDFGALPGEDIARVIGMSRFEASQCVERARARLIDAAGRPEASSAVPVFDLLGIVARAAPSGDLWPQVEAPLRERRARQRRRSRLITGGAVGVALVALVAAVVWLGGLKLWPDDDEPRAAAAPVPSPAAAALPTARSQPVAVEPTPVEPALPVASVPDIQIMMAVQQGDEFQSALLAYDPAANTTGPLLDAGAGATLSPDGHWLVAGRPNPEVSGEMVLSGRALDGSGSEWQVGVPAPRAVTLSNDAVYILTRLDDGSGLLAIRAYDIISGVETTSEPVVTPLGDRAHREIRLFASSDGAMVHILAGLIVEPLRVWGRTLVSFQTSDWTQLEPLTHMVEPVAGQEETRDFDISAALPTPDGEALYSIISVAGTGQLKLQFLDLTSGRMRSLSFPFSAHRISAYRSEFSPQGYHLIPSNTGRMLYVLQTDQRQVAIVDLIERRVEAVLALDPGEVDRPLIETTFRYSTFVESVFSPDGGKLYLINIRLGNYGLNAYVSRSPVWVIDTTTWTIVEHWTVLGRATAITISGDGSAVYVRSRQVSGRLVLTGFDATRGGAVIATYDEIPAPEWSSVQRLTSLANLYRRQYARSPAIGGVEPRDNLDFEVLPAARVEPEDDLALAGAATRLVIRLVDPVSGQSLGAGGADGRLRYDPDATVAVNLIHNDGSEVVVFPSPDGSGVYRARVMLAEPGWWDARITVINRDGSTWTIEQPRAIEAHHPLTAADGEGYGLRIQPDSSVTRRALTIRALPVDPDTGRRQRNIRDPSSFPERLDLVFIHEDGEMVTTTLNRMASGSYIGWAQFADAGRWDVDVSFAGPGGMLVTIAAEPLEIRDISEPWRRTSSENGGAGSAEMGTQ